MMEDLKYLAEAFDQAKMASRIGHVPQAAASTSKVDLLSVIA